MRITSKTAFRKSGIALACVLGIAVGFVLAVGYHDYVAGPAVAAPADAPARVGWRNGFVDVAEKVAPCVVQITSEKMVESRNLLPDMQNFFDFGPFGGPPTMPKSEPKLSKASGSGVIVRADGYILTNNHVVAGADRVEVKLPDGRDLKGEVVTDPRTDLALVKIDATGLPVVQFADSDEVKVGQWAIAMGSPFGFRNTLTVGVVSALRSEANPDDPPIWQRYPETIQTDASINPGNSGGPLLDIDGRMIGINFLIYSSSGGNVGIGFAIPSNTAKFVMGQLIEKGKVVRGYLGVAPRDLTPVLAEKLGVKEGALIDDVTKDSAASKAGIEVKDVIVKVDGKAVNSAIGLRRVVESIAPGTKVQVVVVRDKKQKTLTVTLGEAPSGEEQQETSDGDKVGLSVQPLTADIA